MPVAPPSDATLTDDAVFLQALRGMGLIGGGDAVRITPLTGGVSSDIRLVETAGRRFCAKRALAQLRVAQVWEAPVSRNAAEVAYFRTVAAWQPDFVPRVLGEDARAGLFAMDYLDPADHPLWKTELLAGTVRDADAAAVGHALVQVHGRSAAADAAPALATAFANDDLFEALRLAPYLRATATRHPALADRLHALADATRRTHRALVHGDVSPKNILLGPRGPVLLDAECAWFGDPAFDLAFCLNHLLLKGVHRPASRAGCAAAFRALADAYLGGVDWEPRAALDARAAALLPALFLARVDGKSPVEYLTADAQRETVRAFALPRVARPPATLAELIHDWDAPR